MTTKKKIIAVMAFLLAVGGGSGAYFYFKTPGIQTGDGSSIDMKESTDRLFTLKRDNLVLGLQQGGNVNASQKHKLSLQANFSTKIIWVIDENSKVKKGDELVRFETDDLKEKINDQVLTLDGLRKDLDLAVETQKIQDSTDMAEIQSAEDRLIQAEDALRKYRRFEQRKTRDANELSIKQAEDKYAKAIEDYNTKRNEIAQSSNTDENKEAENNAILRNKLAEIDTQLNSLENAEKSRKVFLRYDHPNKITTLNNAVEQAILNLRKTKVSIESKAVQSLKSIDNLKTRIKKTEEQIQRYNEYLDMMVITAPVDGVVIYGDPDRRWGQIEVKPGLEVHKGQILLTLPEMSNLVVDFDLPEQFRSKVNLNDKVIITPDSIPSLKVPGKISRIDTLPVNLISWDPVSPKIYKSRITLDKQSDRLVNGMTVQVEIVTKILNDVLFVPVEAVFENRDRLFVYKQTMAGGIAEQDVIIGESNANFVQIIDGLEEGDVIYLYRPYSSGQGK